MKKLMLTIILTIGLTIGLAIPCFAGVSVTFLWDANSETDLLGYRLYQSNVSNQYIYGESNAVTVIPVGTETVTLLDVVDGEYWWVLTAYNTKEESGPSNEVTLLVDTSIPIPLKDPTGLSVVYRLSQEGWKVHYVSSEELLHPGLTADKAFDGDLESQWHSCWLSSDPSTRHPHKIQIDLGKSYELNGFYYQTRQGVYWNGTIKGYVFSVSADGQTFTEVVSGELSKTREEQFVDFPLTSARYVEIKALSEINGKTWTVIAEFNLRGH